MKSSAVMAAAAVAIFSCLLVLCAQGQPAGRSSTCLCRDDYVKLSKGFRPRKEWLQVHEPTAFCPQLEITLTMPGQNEKCVDPSSPQGKFALKQHRRQQREARL